MAISYKILVSLLLLSAVNARPTDFEIESHLESESPVDDTMVTNLESHESPQLYLIVIDEKNEAAPSSAGENDEAMAKRSAEVTGDLETAAGTNVLRPLFVYRQQLAYRERVKKGAVKRFGIRPGF